MTTFTLYQVELRFGRKWEINGMAQPSEANARQVAGYTRDMWGADEARIRSVERTLDDRLQPVRDVVSKRAIYV